MARRLLIISYWFPPAGGIPVQRALSLAKYLPQCGYEVHVLAPRNPPAPQLDPKLLQQLPKEVRVHRAFTPMPPAAFRQKLWRLISRRNGGSSSAPAPGAGGSPKRSGALSGVVRRLLSPDPEVVWTPFARREARRIVREHGIDDVLVTAPPFSAFLVGNALKREFPQISLISDFRDDWLRFFLGTFDFQKSPQIRERAERTERETVDGSDLVVVVTDSLREEMRARYPHAPAGKFVCVPNGYDPASFGALEPTPHGGTDIVVSYIGTVYSTTTPRYYLEALEQLPESVRSRVVTRFIGRITDEERSILERSRCRIETLGFMPQSEALRRMSETDYLLVTMTDPTAATGKIYEYLASGKPILAIAPERGEVAQIIRETSAGWCADPENPEGLKTMLGRVFDPAEAPWRSFRPDWNAVRRYERPRLAAEYAAAMSNARNTCK